MNILLYGIVSLSGNFKNDNQFWDTVQYKILAILKFGGKYFGKRFFHTALSLFSWLEKGHILIRQNFLLPKFSTAKILYLTGRYFLITCYICTTTRTCQLYINMHSSKRSD